MTESVAADGDAHSEPEAREDSLDLVAVDLGAEDLRHARQIERHQPSRRRRRDGVNPSRPRRPRTDGLDEVAGTGQRGGCGLEVCAAFEAIRGFGRQAEPLAGAADGCGLEPRALEHDGRGARIHFAVPAAHDAGQRLRPIAVRDDEHVSRERPRLLVERRQRLAGTRGADAERRTRQGGEIERVQRMPQLEQHVVGDVDDVADRADAGCGEPFGKPGGRWTDAHVGNRGAIAGAPCGVLDGHAERAERGGRRLAERPCWRRTQCRRVTRRDLARQSNHAQAVRAVSGDLEVDDRVFGIGRRESLRGRGDRLDRSHLEAGHVEVVRERRRRHRHVHQLAQPRDERLHSGNCSRNRRSFS